MLCIFVRIISTRYSWSIKYSEIPLLRPPKIKTSDLSKILFAKVKLFFSSFSTPSVDLIGDLLLGLSKSGL